jgi:hypothetical protein
MTTNRSVPNRETSSARQAPDSESQFAHWSAHEHIATPVQIEAQKLLEQAGSPELAKHAVDVAAIGRGEGSPQDQFARRLGFASYLSLFEDSSLLFAQQDKQWFVTAIRNGEWILWNDADLMVTGIYATKDAALRAARRNSGNGSVGT